MNTTPVPAPLPIPVEPPFLSKWTLVKFTDNAYQKWNALTFREFATDINGQFARLDALNTNQVRGALYRVPYVALVNGQPTVPTALIPPRFRIQGMDVRALNGTDQASAAAGVKAAPMDFRLLATTAGTVEALVDEKATTTATVKAHWVRTSGTDDEKIGTYPVLPLEDAPLKAGEVYQHTFANLTPAVTRLLEVRNDLHQPQNPVPTGLDSDAYYKPFAPLTAGTGGIDPVQFAGLESRVKQMEDQLGAVVDVAAVSGAKRAAVVQAVINSLALSPPGPAFVLDSVAYAAGDPLAGPDYVGRAFCDIRNPGLPYAYRCDRTLDSGGTERIVWFRLKIQ